MTNKTNCEHIIVDMRSNTVILKRRKKVHQHITSVWFLLYGDDQQQTH